MADVVPLSTGGDAAVSIKSKKSPKAKKTPTKKVTKKPSHPRTMDMVVAAVKNLKERHGSSLSAIKKYIAANYKVDAEKLAPYVRKAIKSALTSGSLVQSKGKGASGSVKLPNADKPVKKAAAKTKKIVKAKKTVAAKPAKPAAKKLTKKAAPKKSITPASPKKVAKPKAVKAPSKAKPAPKPPAKKAAKSAVTKKPKSPKPKKAAVRAKAPARRVAKK